MRAPGGPGPTAPPGRGAAPKGADREAGRRRGAEREASPQGARDAVPGRSGGRWKCRPAGPAGSFLAGDSASARKGSSAKRRPPDGRSLPAGEPPRAAPGSNRPGGFPRGPVRGSLPGRSPGRPRAGSSGSCFPDRGSRRPLPRADAHGVPRPAGAREPRHPGGRADRARPHLPGQAAPRVRGSRPSLSEGAAGIRPPGARPGLRARKAAQGKAGWKKPAPPPQGAPPARLQAPPAALPRPPLRRSGHRLRSLCCGTSSPWSLPGREVLKAGSALRGSPARPWEEEPGGLPPGNARGGEGRQPGGSGWPFPSRGLLPGPPAPPVSTIPAGLPCAGRAGTFFEAGGAPFGPAWPARFQSEFPLPGPRRAFLRKGACPLAGRSPGQAPPASPRHAEEPHGVRSPRMCGPHGPASPAGPQPCWLREKGDPGRARPKGTVFPGRGGLRQALVPARSGCVLPKRASGRVRPGSGPPDPGPRDGGPGCAGGDRPPFPGAVRCGSAGWRAIPAGGGREGAPPADRPAGRVLRTPGTAHQRDRSLSHGRIHTPPGAGGPRNGKA